MHLFVCFSSLTVGLCLSVLVEAYQRVAPCSSLVYITVSLGWPGNPWMWLHTGHLLASSGWEGCGWPPGSVPGNPPGLSSKHSQHCPSTDTGVSCLVGPPGHFSFSWSILAFVPGAFPPLVLSILQPQVLRCPLCPCIPSSCLTGPSFLLAPSAHLSANPSCFSQPQSSFFSLICSSFPAFELSSFSVLLGHNAENERRKRSFKKKIKTHFCPNFMRQPTQNSPKHAKCGQICP